MSLPEKSYFVSSLIKRTEQQPDNYQIGEYLSWVKRFYFGSALYNSGWLDISAKVIKSVTNAQESELVKNKMNIVGKNIATEWALDNRIRNITTANIIVWKHSLEKSIGLNEPLVLLNKVSKDVIKLTNKVISTSEINIERYYRSENYDF